MCKSLKKIIIYILWWLFTKCLVKNNNDILNYLMPIDKLILKQLKWLW